MSLYSISKDLSIIALFLFFFLFYDYKGKPLIIHYLELVA